MFLPMILQFEPKEKDDPTLLFLSIVIGIVLIIVIVMVVQHESEKEHKQLRSILAAKGHTNIVLTRTSMPLSDGDTTYNVEYTDADGQRHKTACKLSGNDVFWKDPV